MLTLILTLIACAAEVDSGFVDSAEFYDCTPALDGLERCNGMDDDCDGLVDEDVENAVDWFSDADGDGYGNAGVHFRGCQSPGEDWSQHTGDCDDEDPNVNPGAEEQCGNVDDDDCDGLVDEDVCVNV